MKKQLSLIVLFGMVVLTGCSGDGNTIVADNAAGPGAGPIDPGVVTVDMGSGTPPGGFTSGIMEVAVASLAAGGSTSLTVTFVTSLDTLHTEPVTVTFSSTCLASGLAEISGSTMTDTGILAVTYSATGCTGDDVINATATVNGLLLSATGNVNVAPSTVGSIEFISATPPQIGLSGTGGVGIPETSTVVFRVVDSTGGPSIGRAVSFTANTLVGGISLTPDTVISGADGNVQTVVQAGSVQASVRITATVTDVTPNISTQSSELTITTGLPDQNSISLAVETYNVEGWNLDGTLDLVTARLSDRFNNPVPDGTAVTLSTEGGKITGNCTTETIATESGICTVNWVSQNPRPFEQLPSRAGRSTIYMTTIGEESFVDVNGNGFFDDGDTFTDLGEPFLDENEDGIYNSGEPFFDFDSSGGHTPGDSLFSGLLCGGPDTINDNRDTLGRCAPNATTAISASNIIIMSASSPDMSAPFVLSPGGGVLTGGGSVCYWIRDLNEQPMPAGTVISVTISNGGIVGPSSYTVPNMLSDAQVDNTYCFQVLAEDPAAPPASGNMFLSVLVPSGLETLNSQVILND